MKMSYGLEQDLCLVFVWEANLVRGVRDEDLSVSGAEAWHAFSVSSPSHERFRSNFQSMQQRDDFH